METIEVSSEALHILKEGGSFQEKLVSRKYLDYSTRLKTFEEKHGMSSEEFRNRFESGVLGDDAEWFDWLYVYEAYNATLRRKALLESLPI
jgi:hypothetical protein